MEAFNSCIEFKHIDGTRVNCYVAKILGSDPQYIFRRKFVPYRKKSYKDYTVCWYTIYVEGVYEESIDYYDIVTDKLIKREREWFIFFGDTIYDIDKSEVLFSLFNLRLQCAC